MRAILAIVTVVLASPSVASAANILFVSDSASDTNIPTVLTADGHTVTVVTNDYMAGANPTLNGSLAAYDAIYWSATGTGFGDNTSAATRTNLESYVNAGGMLFITGYDSIASPTDAQLVAMLGGTGAIDVPGAPGAIAMVANEITTGVVDIRGLTPTGAAGDRDALTGFGAGVTVIVSTTGSPTQAQWLLRSLGRGRIAYVSNGDASPSAHPSWANTVAGGAGVFNAALRNFAFWSTRARVLFVSDAASDTNIPAVLSGDGHVVTTVTNDFMAGANPTLNGSLAAYDVIVWSATGGGFGDNTSMATRTSVENYLTSGGRVFITGYDSIASPTDAQLIALMGGTGAVDVPGAPGAVSLTANELNTGVVDIRGVTPTGAASDRDALTGAGAGVTVVVSTTGAATQAQWLLRPIGTGLLAYVSNGDPSPSTHASWTNTTAGGAGAYNAAVRNFVHHAARTRLPVGRPNGSPCGAGSECVSSFCADGVCCASACAGGATDCQACSLAAGGTADGTCTALSATAAPTVTCRAAAGGCDAAERCTSASTTCPADMRVAAGTSCRSAAGACDVGESCDGVSATCPADSFATAGTSCRAATGVCDVAESCDGATAACPPDNFVAAGTMCRASGGVCDVAEACTGASGACPADALVTAGTVCRMPAGLCDLAEACTGADAACPGDAFAGAGTVCRASIGTCDVDEACSGAGPDCPGDAFAAAGTLCRGAADLCDAAESCDGATGSCPADAVAAAGTECRGASGPCDVAEVCDGAARSCAPDGFASDGTACADGTTCNGDEVCTAGACTPGTAPDCDDGNVCTTDSCAEPTGCSSEAIAGCCIDDAGCDDGDVCTGDVCDLATNTCMNDVLPACLDGGMIEEDAGMAGDDAGMADEDGGTGSDAGSARDAGRRTSPRDEGGCCHVASSRDTPHPWRMVVLGLLLAAAIFRRRRR